MLREVIDGDGVLRLPFGLFKGKPVFMGFFSAMADRALRVSVIVPIYEHWHIAARLFAALESQDFPKENWECLVVDNGSRDVPSASRLPSFVTLLTCETPGSYAARNAAIAQAKGALLVFTDSDCVPDRDWLSKQWSAYQYHGNRSLLAGGISVEKFDDAPLNVAELYDSVMGLPQARYVKRGYAVTANLAVPSEVMAMLEGFDGTRFSGGDADICHRAARKGIGLAYIPDALVRHPARSSIHEIIIKLRRVKGGQMCAGALRRRAKFFIKTYVPPVWLYWYIVSSARLSLLQKFHVMALQTRLWGVEMVEVIRLLLGQPPERR